MIGVLLVLAAGAAIGFFNGANDVSKGIATLVGSGVSDYKKAIAWGTLFTAIGGVGAALVGGAMVTTFGKGLLAPGVTPTLAAAVATILGATAWVLFATRTGLPVSTTHAIVGSIAGVAVAAYGSAGFAWGVLGAKVALPLALSPVLSFALCTASLAAVRRVRPAAGAAPKCVCAELKATAPASMAFADGGAAALAPSCPVHLEIVSASAAECETDRPAALKLTADGAMNTAHWLTAGATSFARGLNDAPKMAALVLAATALATATGATPPSWTLVFAVVTAGMVAGSLVGGRKITAVLAEKVTKMDHQEGFAANAITSVLVAAGALWGLPMSTTHVSSGAIVGAGALKGGVDWKVVRGMALAWIVTLPAAAMFGIVAYELVLHVT